MNEIKILPIFNQTLPGVWNDFVRIQSTRMSEYNGIDNLGVDDMLKAYSCNWSIYAHNYAFAAYDGRNMIGFIHGYAWRSTAKVEGLYILPDYRRNGIGKRLLSVAEISAYPRIARMDLIALPQAMSFYQKRGYHLPSYDKEENHFVKKLGARCMATTIPLFNSTSSVTKQLMTINADYDASWVNMIHRPTFVYVDINGRIQAYVDSSGVFVAKGAPRDFLESKLRRVFDEYTANAAGVRGR